MSKKKEFAFVVIMSIAIVLGVTQSLWAGLLSGGKIGVIDVNKIFRNSKAASHARNMFLMDIESKKGILKSKEEQIRAEEKALTVEEGQKKDPAALEKKKEELAQAVNSLRRLRDDMEAELKKKEQELKQRLLDEIKAVAQEFIKKERYAIVLEKKMVVAYDDAVDITDEIIALYDASTP